jgi:uncharacterized RDD family membrane protein YckC
MILYNYFSRKFKAESRTDNLEYADFSSRYLSLLLDLVVMILILKFLYSGISLVSKIASNQNSKISSTSAIYKHKFEIPLGPEEQEVLKSVQVRYILFQVFGFFSIFAYLILTWYYFGGTIGNLVFGIRILSEKKVENGIFVEKLSLKTCFIRLFALILTFFTFFIGFFSAFFNSKKMTLYDKLSGTIAIKNRSLKNFAPSCCEQICEFDQKDYRKDFIRIDILEIFFEPIMKKICGFFRSNSS